MTKSFSQRQGIKPVKSIMQINEMDGELRISLWNALTDIYWDCMEDYKLKDNRFFYFLIRRIWSSYFKEPLDNIHEIWFINRDVLKKRFFEYQWNEVYDFIEFIVNNDGCENSSRYCDLNEIFVNACNFILQQEMSGYRFVENQIVPITNETEIKAIKEVLACSGKYNVVSIHFDTALKHLADRKNPDYRNSIKESMVLCQDLEQIKMRNSSAY